MGTFEGETKVTITDATMKEALRQYFETHAAAFLEDGKEITKVTRLAYEPTTYEITFGDPPKPMPESAP